MYEGREKCGRFLLDRKFFEKSENNDIHIIRDDHMYM